MPASLVECIPNFSEARRPEVIAAIRRAIESVPGATILDLSSDLDHNRTVITFVGEPQAVEEAAYQAIAEASRLIDMEQHRGAHPRLGATDVVPFVPIREITMPECVQMARRLGQRVGESLGIPVYLYEEAATRPERKDLENIRRGQYEGLKAEIASNPARQPDYGPASLGSAGATVIGARQPLVAFNVYLTTSDVSIAQKIAKVLRHSSGGFHFIKAMGVLVNGRAQVSMNMTNFHQSALHHAVETIRREAQRYGTAIHHSELVGLIPQEALIDSAVWYLQLDAFHPSQILEGRMAQALPSGAGGLKEDFLDRLASGTPTPGGGSAAAHTGAAAAALVAMVSRLTLGKKKYAAVESRMLEILAQAEMLRQELSAAVEIDAQAFDALMAAYRLPKGTPEEQVLQDSALESATLHAAEVPLGVAQRCLQVMRLGLETAQTGNQNAASDSSSAVILAQAALTCAGFNVRTNLKGLAGERASQMLALMAETEQAAVTVAEALRRWQAG
ncbi:MAG TPA: glutamate formimidoyltransferase [Anaerolineaceae bacterium]